MPTYQYVCKECGHDFSEFQSMSEARLEVCPKCGQKTLKRKIGTGAGMLFKGNGFYCTDYTKSNASPTTSATGCQSNESSGKTHGSACACCPHAAKK